MMVFNTHLKLLDKGEKREMAESEDRTTPDLEVILPVHNEGESIEAVIREIYEAVSPHASLRFIISEDGSVDDTKVVLSGLAEKFPTKLIMSEKRKGYSRAMMDGLMASEAPWILCLDSDGQIDPKDFLRFWELRNAYDFLIGWRVKRADPFWRILLSRVFYLVYRAFLGVKLHDPSCSLILARKTMLDKLVPQLGAMQQGFQWELVAHAHIQKYSFKELPIKHRVRLKGKTKVYRLKELPGIGYRHLVALFTIWWRKRTYK